MSAISNYWNTLVDRFGNGWNRFWFLPSDPLPLCVMRLCVGVLACWVIGSYGFDLQRLFGPGGLLPADAVNQFRGGSTYLSYLYLLDTPGALWAGWALGLLVVALFTAGVYTRITSVLALVVVLSFFHRGPMLTHPLENILAMTMFYLCLGPCGRYLSVDALLSRRKQNAAKPVAHTSSWATVSLRLIQLHVALIYFMFAIAKASNEAWWTGQAAWWLIARYEMTPVDLSFLHAWPLVLDAWTHFVLLFELAFAFLIWNRTARPLLLVLAPIVYLSVALLTGLFAMVLMMVIANLAFVPAAFFLRCRGQQDEAGSAQQAAKEKRSKEVAVASA